MPKKEKPRAYPLPSISGNPRPASHGQLYRDLATVHYASIYQRPNRARAEGGSHYLGPFEYLRSGLDFHDWDRGKDWCSCSRDTLPGTGSIKWLCYLHDKAYEIGGTKKDKRRADNAFALAILQQAMRRGHVWFGFWHAITRHAGVASPTLELFYKHIGPWFARRLWWRARKSVARGFHYWDS